jgi:hypothetical protein
VPDESPNHAACVPPWAVGRLPESGNVTSVGLMPEATEMFSGWLSTCQVGLFESTVPDVSVAIQLPIPPSQFSENAVLA